jgi:D-alanyl-D-alanine endopeptidase (penicillin-binding protein 7)
MLQMRFAGVVRPFVALVGICVAGFGAEEALTAASLDASARTAGSSLIARANGPHLAAQKKTSKKRPTAAARARARRARLARARAAARARQLRELAQPRFKLNERGELVPDVRAAAAIIYNPETDQVLWESNSQDPRSIASITKVMTAAVILEGQPNPERVVTMTRADVTRASHTYLRAGERLTIDDLLHLTLIASDNAAARALARTSPLGTARFIDRMNEKAAELGLEHTTYADPSGLDARNVSSAYDMARLIAFASSDERLASIMRKPHHTVLTSRRALNVNNTNQLVGNEEVDVRGGKTGFISKAGYCLATLLRLPQTNQQVAVVILGARSSAGRFWETRHLFNWLSSKTQSLNVLTSAPAVGGVTAQTVSQQN